MSETLPLGIDFDSILAPVESGTKRNQKIEAGENKEKLREDEQGVRMEEQKLREMQQRSRELDGQPNTAENIQLASALVQEARKPHAKYARFPNSLQITITNPDKLGEKFAEKNKIEITPEGLAGRIESQNPQTIAAQSAAALEETFQKRSAEVFAKTWVSSKGPKDGYFSDAQSLQKADFFPRLCQFLPRVQGAFYQEIVDQTDPASPHKAKINSLAFDVAVQMVCERIIFAASKTDKDVNWLLTDSESPLFLGYANETGKDVKISGWVANEKDFSAMMAKNQNDSLDKELAAIIAENNNPDPEQNQNEEKAA